MHDSHMMINLHVSIQLYYIVDLVVITFVLAFCNVTSNLQNSVPIEVIVDISSLFIKSQHPVASTSSCKILSHVKT